MSSNEVERWGSNGITIVAPRVAPAERDEYYWKSHDVNNNSNSYSINAVSYGFLATAVLISMFLVMAIFEKFFMPKSSSPSPSASRTRSDLEAQMSYGSKPDYPSPKMRDVYPTEVTVLMPGDEIPSFVAYPAPTPQPCPPTRINWHLHQHNPPYHCY